MKQHNSTYFRSEMNKVFNECVESGQPVMITTNKKGCSEPQQIVVISKVEFDLMKGLSV